MARDDPQPPLKKPHLGAPAGGSVVLDAKSAVINATWSKSAHTGDGASGDSNHINGSRDGGVVMEFASSSFAHAPPVYVDDGKATHGLVTGINSSSSTRKRQLPPSPPPSQVFSRGSAVAFSDFKLDFAGYEMGSSNSNILRPTHAYGAVAGEENPHEVIELLKSLHLTIRLDPSVLAQVADKLMYYGFDSTLALAFASTDDLQHCGLLHQVDAQAVYQHARREFAARHFEGPAVLSNAYTVSRWLMLCGVPRKCAYEYTERLCRYGYPAVSDFELIVHDERALSDFRIGHRRLFVHCVTVALHNAQQQQQQHVPHHLVAPQHAGHHGYGGPVYDGGSSSTLLQPLEIHRENEFDSFLDVLIDPSSDAARYGGVDSSYLHVQQHYQQHVAAAGASYGRFHDEHDASGGDSDGEYGAPDFFRSAAGSADQLLLNMGYGGGDDAVLTAGTMRTLPPDAVQLLYEAVNLPRPNPCRRGKKIYWSVLANKGMKDDRFAPLERYTAAELQNAYLRQFELPPAATSGSGAGGSGGSKGGKTDTWSEENIRQLENAVKDPRCRHLSKVCWEMLATGRTGVDEYQSLSNFSASQLRSRFRSLFGDKRPQKLRQKKQMLKMQQQAQAQALAQQQQQHDAFKKL